jgi:tetratricopeptide (TPR) repeat protein
MEAATDKRITRLICLGLALAVLAAYWPLRECGFVSYDDVDYIVSNGIIHDGVNARSIAWAFTSGYAGNWHPLTWISHALDCQIYGTNAVGHHFTSLGLHVANSILLFLLLRRMTRAMWPSAAVAALFGLHPMHVESVAWISERKDVLSTLFWLLTLWAYVRYVEALKTKNQKSKFFYATAVFLFALGLMSKPMLVTLPFVLLLLDYWPLERGARLDFRRVAEKVPFLVLAAACCVIACRTQQPALSGLTDLSVGERFLGVPMSYLGYLEKMFWPAHLAILYPLPLAWPVWQSVGAGVILALVTAGTLLRRQAHPYLAVGWLWFLGTLVPVIGLVQVGVQYMADRYDYIPSIGFWIMIIWAVREWTPRLGANAATAVAGAALAGCMALTWVQVGYWKDSEKLFSHALEVTDDNGPVESFLGDYLLDKHRAKEALPHLLRSAQLNRSPPGVLGSLGRALLAEGRATEALNAFKLDVRLHPEDPVAQFDLGCMLLDNGLPGNAVPYLQKALQLRSGFAECHYKLGNAFRESGQAAEAIGQYEETSRLNPHYIEAAANLACMLASSPDASIRDGPRAAQLALSADEWSGGKNPRVLGTLAAAYAEEGKYSDAVATVQRALQVTGPDDKSALADTLRTNLALYQAGSPLRDPLPQQPHPQDGKGPDNPAAENYFK